MPLVDDGHDAGHGEVVRLLLPRLLTNILRITDLGLGGVHARREVRLKIIYKQLNVKYFLVVLRGRKCQINYNAMIEI